MTTTSAAGLEVLCASCYSPWTCKGRQQAPVSVQHGFVCNYTCVTRFYNVSKSLQFPRGHCQQRWCVFAARHFRISRKPNIVCCDFSRRANRMFPARTQHGEKGLGFVELQIKAREFQLEYCRNPTARPR